MPLRTRLTKHSAAAGADAAMEDVEICGWERSKLTNQDKKSLKKLGLLKKKDSLIFPGDKSAPNPPIGYRVTFVDHLIRGLSTPLHEFLRGLLFVYGIQMHQLTPNSILHISIFITLCECFLGTHPHWGMWKRIFYLRRNNSPSIVYNVGGVCICVRSDVDYFDVKFPNSVQGWRKRWLYIKDETVGSQEYDIAPFDGAAEILKRRCWDAEASAEEKAATDTLMKRIHQLQNTRGEELSGVQITAYFLRIRVQPLQALKNPLWAYAGEEDIDLLSVDLSTKALEKLIRRFSSLRKKDEVPTSCRVEPYSGSHALPEPLMDQFIRLGSQSIGFRNEAHTLKASLHRAEERAEALRAKLKLSEEAREKAQADAASIEDLRQRLSKAETALSDKIAEQITRQQDIIDRLEAQSRRFLPGRNNEGFKLLAPKDDRLLDALSILELQGDLACTNLSDSRISFSHLFLHFFPKQAEPEIFAGLVKRFLPNEDLALAYRRENLKIGVEGTIALVANNGQQVDWAKAGDAGKINKDKWKAPVKDAKPHSKKIIAFFTPKSAGSTSTAKTEVK
ncbi:hypothetical protein QYE76_042164 [Lolium multiflorum]|uniref:Transposase (putative) gypsy type domain-containing protein n=1 Tax=Lolium multiflorum TaxID=4521 RepID=A0AAD8WWP7_LOLMU|nr:hypothetical protein QYE76_042164 [Lolium multiflorum]